MPLSSQKLNEAIEATKAEHERDDMKKVRAQVVNDIRKTRGAVIAAEKEYESREKAIGTAARKTADLMKTAEIKQLTKQRTAELTQEGQRVAAIQSQSARQAQQSAQQSAQP